MKPTHIEITSHEHLASLTTHELQVLLRDLRRNYSSAESILAASLVKKEEAVRLVAIARASVSSARQLVEQVDDYLYLRELTKEPLDEH